MEAYKRQAADVEFQDATQSFEELRTFVGSQKALEFDHYLLEQEIGVRGREVLRRLLQDHLTLRTRLEVPRPITGEDGVRRSHMRDSHRPLMTLFGPVHVWRTSVGARGHESRFPLDAGLNLPPEEHSHGVRERIAVEVAKNSFDEAVEAVTTTTGAAISKLQAEKLATEASQDFDAFYAEKSVEEVRAEATEIVVMTTDCKGIVVRKKDLREATRKKAEKSAHKLDKRLSRGEKRNRKRMATVAAVYTIQPYVRTAEDVVGELRPVKDASPLKRPKPRQKRVWASVKKKQEEVIAEIFDEGDRRDPERKRTRCVLLDGNIDQLDRVKNEARRRALNPILILDIIHVLEYLWKAAYCFHPDGSKEAEAWVTERFRHLLNGQVSDVAAGIRRSATLREFAASQRKAADTCADYFLNNKDYMRYDEYLALGLPIATGVIEGACRHLVKDRMDLTGARWSLDGADAILRLRALRSSGDFDAYWQYHLQRELLRNHVSRYEAGAIRPSTEPILRIVR
jgi:hypothetical protein